ncbi:GNAT family N-acetyltransferase [Alteromonas sp. ASW11-130]|uniref:GNAT family N-acetyltransferase n=1 Tax=Alteromonas sp. ASW11-130 TaxID=3015775 RepID=UPI0022427F04|nr:GNAT family N-acetyltransferase [Alteromonas sp. ASW11-130]MCW8092860.1 GNAT family N-acetyltransferase [Alteromonas sp. ASW11-130]
MALDVKFHTQFSAFDRTHWNTLKGTESPFLRSEFLIALEDANCVGEGTGWKPFHIGFYENSQLIAAMPGYLKKHSYGEYVFDHAWANAYVQHRLNYYPKWVSAVPFTPVPGGRLLMRADVNRTEVLDAFKQALDLLAHNDISSAHILFPDESNRMVLSDTELLQRDNVQFHWHNYGYHVFEDFIEGLTARKRKSIRKSRQRLLNHGVSISRLQGQAICHANIIFFYQCYRDTYLKKSGHEGYLTLTFFEQLFASMQEQMLIVEAEYAGKKVASCLFFFDHSNLYGRYWGCLEDIEELHFECCYFQGIEFAIEHGLQTFNPGTQGEHKILRGFEPTFCYSFHKLFQPEFNTAVAHFLNRESPAIKHYFEQAKTVLPFNEHMSQKLICNK